MSEADDSRKDLEQPAVLRITRQMVESNRMLFLTMAIVLLTLIMTWPLPRDAGSAVQDLGDPLHQTWTMRWIQHQLTHNPGSLLDGNIGHPFPMSLLFSEAQPSTSLIAWPTFALTGNEILMYNIMVLLTFFTTALGMALLVREITGNSGVGFLTGLVAAFTPYRYGHLSHLNLLNYGWLLLAVWLLLRYARTRNRRDAILGGIFFTIQVHASDTLALMSLPVAGTALLIVVWSNRNRLDVQFVMALASIVIVPWITMVPTAIARFRLNAYYGFSRDLEDIRRSAATLRDYWSVYPGDHLWANILPTAYPNPLFPGAIALAGALAAVIAGWHFRKLWTGGALVLATTGVVLSLGPEAAVLGQTATLPYYWLFQYVPGFNSMRDVARFGLIALIGVHILTGIGFSAAWLRLRMHLSPRHRTPSGIALLAAMSFVAVIEVRTEVGTVYVDRSHGQLAVYEWLREQPRGPVFELPADGLLRDATIPTQQMYYSIFHWRPVFSLHASFVPREHYRLIEAFHRGVDETSKVNQDNIGIIQDLGFRYLIIPHAEDYDWERAIEEAESLSALQHASTFENATVYVIEPADAELVHFEIAFPTRVVPGHSVAAIVLIENSDNSYRVTDEIEVSWRNMDTEAVTKTRATPHVLVADAQSTSIHVLTFKTPAEAGDYQVEIKIGGGKGRAEAEVEVVSSEPPVIDGVQATALATDWSPSDVRSGETLRVESDWLIHQQFDQNTVMTVQLLDEDNTNVLDWNGDPFEGGFRLQDLEPETTARTVVDLPIPDDFPSGRYQILIAYYQWNDPELPRLPISFPDGTVQGEQIIDGVEVRD